jgi:signal transduction histidine kinase
MSPSFTQRYCEVLGRLARLGRRLDEGAERVDQEAVLGRLEMLVEELERSVQTGRETSPRRDHPAADNHSPLWQRIFQSQESRQARLARELHDGLSQTLTAVLLRLQMAIVSPTLEATRSHFTELKRLCAQAVADTHRLRARFWPSILDDFGVGEALKELVSRLHRPGGPRIDLDVSEPAGGRLPAEVETALYWIVREALLNVSEHAGARSVSVRLICQPGQVLLQVEDNCCGFDATTPEGFGLCSMRERAALLKGTCTIRSVPGQGTAVVAHLPLPGEANHAQDSGTHR